MIVFGPMEDTYYYKHHDFGDVKDLNMWSLEGTGTVLGAIIFSLSFTVAIFPAYQSLEPREPQLITEVTS